MALSQRLEFRQSQALVMTPQLMQAIKLLQLSNLDLSAYVEGELEKNPLLERAAEDDGPPDNAREAGAGETGVDSDGGAPAETSAPADRIDDSLETSRSAIEERLGTDLENEFPDDSSHAAQRTGVAQPIGPSDWSSVGTGGREDGDYNLESFVSAELTLADHLAEQLALA